MIKISNRNVHFLAVTRSFLKLLKFDFFLYIFEKSGSSWLKSCCSLRIKCSMSYQWCIIFYCSIFITGDCVLAVFKIAIKYKEIDVNTRWLFCCNLLTNRLKIFNVLVVLISFWVRC